MQATRAFVRRHGRLLAAIFVVVLAVQLLYPRGVARPLTFSNGTYLGVRSSDALEKYYAGKIDQPLTIAVAEKEAAVQPRDLGFSTDRNQINQRVANYPFWQRLIPSSVIWPSFVAQDDWRSVDQAKFETFSQELSATYYVAPVSAGAAKNEQGDFELSASKTGRELSKETIMTSLRELQLEGQRLVRLSISTVDPAVSDEVVKQVIDKTRVENLQPITFKVSDKTYPVAPKAVQSWLVVEIDEQQKTARLGFDQQVMNTWIDENIKTVNSGRPTVITLRDGVEISRVPGVPGQGLDKQKAKESLKQAVLTQQKDVVGEITTLPVTTQTNRTYSPTSNGLRLLLDEWQKEYPGMQSAVYLRELSGRGLSAERNADSSLFAASVTKLFVAQYLFDTIPDLGQILYSDRSYDACIDLMIRNSDNPCVEKVGEIHGYNTLTRHALNKGFAQTNLSANTTSARNAGQYIERLYAGSMLDPGKTARMLSLMRSQIYRSGIPAGAVGASVADKPGFFGDSWHDAALVQSPGSTYVLVIMSKGPGANAVKTLAQRINQTLNQ